MILLYTSLLLLLSAIKRLVGLRARSLERKYMRLAGGVDQLVRQQDCKPGNGRYDPCVGAKRTYLLGQLVQQRDRVEAKHFAWQRGVERLNGWIGSMRAWKGKKLPYSLGAVDVWMLLSLVDYLGVGQYLSAGAVAQTVALLFTP